MLKVCQLGQAGQDKADVMIFVFYRIINLG
jgi:hypothetical protein